MSGAAGWLGTARHLASRFFDGLDPRGPDVEAERFVARVLLPGERALWRRMSGPDRRHAVLVVRQVQAELGEAATRPVLAAALLHDVGKVEAGLSTVARVPATLLGLVAWRRASAGDGRIARYLRHSEIGARLLAAAGSDSLTVAWAAEHHLPPERWTVAPELAQALKAADND